MTKFSRYNLHSTYIKVINIFWITNRHTKDADFNLSLNLKSINLYIRKICYLHKCAYNNICTCVYEYKSLTISTMNMLV